MALTLPGVLGVPMLPLDSHTQFPWSPIPSDVFSAALIGLLLGVAVRAGAYRFRHGHPLTQHVIIVGTSRLAHELATELQRRRHLRQTVCGFIDEGIGTLGPGCRHLGTLADLLAVVERVCPHRVIVALAARRGRMPLKTLLELRLRGIIVEDGVDVYERLTGKIAIEALTPSSLIFCKDYRAFRLGLVVARALSLPVAAAVLLLAAPLLLLVALAIKLDSHGPVFFIQERVGRKGRLFRLIKFRTMRPGPVGSATSEWARDNRGRLTRVGVWLRRFRLDELPQLVNVIKGDMNLVGPRPHPGSNASLFVTVMRNTPECGEQIPYYALRSLVRPGITGWAQVRYKYANDLEEEVEKMRYDLYYIKHMSVWLDLRILLMTIRIVALGRESAHKPVADERPPTRTVRRTRSGAHVVLDVAAPQELGLASAAPMASAMSDCGRAGPSRRVVDEGLTKGEAC